MEFTHTTLDNGLTIIGEVNPAAASMAAGFFVRTGSRDETSEVAGVSHFLEHMMFKGTARRSAFDVNREFDEIGASYNAFTSEENTVYYAAVLPEYMEGVVDLLGDMLRPALRQEDFDVEKNVIIDEIARYEDTPSYRVYEKAMAQFFAGHPLANSVLGTPESVSALRREQMLEYFNRRYSPTNVTVVGVGRFVFDAFVVKVRRMCGHWQPYDAPRDTSPPPCRRGHGILCDPKVLREHVTMMSPAPAGQDYARYPAQLVAAVIGDVTGSRLFYALIDPAIADEAHMGYDLLDGGGAFVTFLSTDAERAREALDIALAEYHKFLAQGPTEPELVAAKNKIASGSTLKGELPMGRLTAVGFDWVYRREYIPLAQQIQTLFAVPAEEVWKTARQYDLTATSTLALGPLETM